MLSNSELYPGYFEYFIISVYYKYISLNPGEFIFVLVIILLSYVQTASSSPSSISCDPIVVSVFKDFVVLLGSVSHCGLVGDDLLVQFSNCQVFLLLSDPYIYSSRVSSEVHKLFYDTAFPKLLPLYNLSEVSVSLGVPLLSYMKRKLGL